MVEVIHCQQMQTPLHERPKRTAETPPKILYLKPPYKAIFINKKSTGSPRMYEASFPSTKARLTAGALSNNNIPETILKSNP